MATIKDKLRFNFDGKWSNEFGLINVVLDSGMYDDVFVAGREIIENKVSGQRKPFFSGIDESPIEFEMNIVFENDFTSDSIDDVIRWLFADYYKPLYFEGAENRVFYCMPVGDSRLIHNGINQGYFTITMRCNSSNVYSPTYLSQMYDLSDGVEQIIDMYNNGHYTIYPEISIDKIDAGNIVITSMTDGGSIFQISNLNNLESIYINCEKETIETDIIGIYRYDNMLGFFPKLTYGKNTFKISGKCKIQFRYQYKFKH